MCWDPPCWPQCHRCPCSPKTARAASQQVPLFDKPLVMSSTRLVVVHGAKRSYTIKKQMTYYLPSARPLVLSCTLSNHMTTAGHLHCFERHIQTQNDFWSRNTAEGTLQNAEATHMMSQSVSCIAV